MTDDESKKLILEVHDFLLKEVVPGTGVTRAKQIDELLTAARTGKLAARAALWFAGAIVALGAAITTWRGMGE